MKEADENSKPWISAISWQGGYLVWSHYIVGLYSHTLAQIQCLFVRHTVHKNLIQTDFWLLFLLFFLLGLTFDQLKVVRLQPTYSHTWIYLVHTFFCFKKLVGLILCFWLHFLRVIQRVERLFSWTPKHFILI